MHLKLHFLALVHCEWSFSFLEIVQQIVGADGLNVLINNAGMKRRDESQEVYLQTFKVGVASLTTMMTTQVFFLSFFFLYFNIKISNLNVA